MKAHLHLWQGAMMIALCACSQRDYLAQIDTDNDRDNEYTHTWIKKFKVPAPDQNWCMLHAVDAEIATTALGQHVTTLIYNDTPANGGHVIGVATADGTLRLDIKKGLTQIYAEVADAAGQLLAAGMYAIDGDRVRIDGSANDAATPASRYAHDTSNGRSWFDAMIACEDLGSARDSDFDFNDIVFGLQHVAGTKTLTVTPMASGGKIPATISITVDDKTYEVGESHDLIRKGCPTTTMLNTTNPFEGAGRSVNIPLPSSSWTISDAWANKQIAITIKGAGQAYELTPVSEGEAPKMICIGGDWYWPIERKPINEAYPGFSKWAQGDAQLTSWVDDYSSASDVVAWQWSQAANNWFSATSTASTYDAKINYSSTVTINSDERYYMYPATSTREMFSGRTDLTSVSITGDHFNTESVTNTYNMFKGCTGLTSIDLSNWNTSNLANPYYMFDGCESLETLNLTGWDFTPFEGYRCELASNCPNITKLILNDATITQAISYVSHSAWNDPYFKTQKSTLTEIEAQNCKMSGTDMSYLFSGYSVLERINLNGWNTSEITSMTNLFDGCSSLQTINLSGWDISNVKSTQQLFSGLENATEINIDGWTTSSLQNASLMFQNCKQLTTLDLSSWDTSNLSNAQNIVDGCDALESLDLSGWYLDRVKNASLGSAPALTYLKMDGATLTTPMGATTYVYSSALFEKFNNLQTISAKNCKSSGTSLSKAFQYLHKLETIDLSNLQLDEQVTDLSWFLAHCESLESVNLTNCDMSHVTNFKNMFSGCKKLTSIIGAFENWDIPVGTDASYMFSGCESLTDLDLSGWDTSSLPNMSGFLNNCNGLQRLNLSGWPLAEYKQNNINLGTSTSLTELIIDGATITELMFSSYYTYGTSVLKGMGNELVYISAKNCRAIGSSLKDAFSNRTKLEEIDLSGSDLSAATDLTYMFYSCKALREVNLTGCTLSDAVKTTSMFSGCTSLRKITCSSSTKAVIESTIPSTVTVEWVIVD